MTINCFKLQLFRQRQDIRRGPIRTSCMQPCLSRARINAAPSGWPEGGLESGGSIMSFSSKIRCHEVAPHLDRRSVLAGIAGLIVLVPVTSSSAQDEMPLANLVGPNGQASDLARSMTGQTVGSVAIWHQASMDVNSPCPSPRQAPASSAA